MVIRVPSSSARVITCLGRWCIGLRVFANAAVLTLLEQDSMTDDAFNRERGADALPDTW